MRKTYGILLLVIYIFTLFILQIYVFNKISFFDVYANIILVGVIAISIWQKPLVANIASTIMGILSDLLFTSSIGKSVIAYLIISVLVQIFSKFYRKETTASYIYITAITTIIFEIFMMITKIFVGQNVNLIYLFIIIIEETIINIALCFILGRYMKKVSEYIFRKS